MSYLELVIVGPLTAPVQPIASIERKDYHRCLKRVQCELTRHDDQKACGGVDFLKRAALRPESHAEPQMLMTQYAPIIGLDHRITNANCSHNTPARRDDAAGFMWAPDTTLNLGLEY